jgi:hypothetical protein
MCEKGVPEAASAVLLAEVPFASFDEWKRAQAVSALAVD